MQHCPDHVRSVPAHEVWVWGTAVGVAELKPSTASRGAAATLAPRPRHPAPQPVTLHRGPVTLLHGPVTLLHGPVTLLHTGSGVITERSTISVWH